MNLIIDLTESEEARLEAAAEQNGLAPAELVKKLVVEHLPLAQSNGHHLNAILQQWQQQDDIELYPNASARELSARWAIQDAAMTPQEREAENKLWDEVIDSLNQTRTVTG